MLCGAVANGSLQLRRCSVTAERRSPALREGEEIVPRRAGALRSARNHERMLPGVEKCEMRPPRDEINSAVAVASRLDICWFLRVTIADTKPQTSTPTQSRRPDLEQMAAVTGTAVAAVWLVLTTFNAGPLWRDETNSINLAQMPSLKEFWHNLPFESFPPFWLLLLRGLSFAGMASSDASIRMIGLLVGLAFLGSL